MSIPFWCAFEIPNPCAPAFHWVRAPVFPPHLKFWKSCKKCRKCLKRTNNPELSCSCWKADSMFSFESKCQKWSSMLRLTSSGFPSTFSSLWALLLLVKCATYESDAVSSKFSSVQSETLPFSPHSPFLSTLDSTGRKRNDSCIVSSSPLQNGLPWLVLFWANAQGLTMVPA